MVHLNGARKQGDPVRVLVAATGTDLGKTHIACALLRHWRAEGLDPLPLKPLQSGFELGAADTSDAGLLLAALATAWLARLFARRIRGFTGDCLGAVQQLSEAAFYLGVLAASR